MRTWKIEIGIDEEGPALRQGYVLAKTQEEARAIAQEAHRYPVTIVHEKHPAMLWPGRHGERLCWSN